MLSTYEDVDEVIERANDTPYGLQAGLFSNDIRVINRAFERLEVGALIVNDVNTFRVDQMPYGGAKRSGHGREGMRWTIREMTEETTSRHRSPLTAVAVSGRPAVEATGPPAIDLAALAAVERRVLWLATRIVDYANRERPKRGRAEGRRPPGVARRRWSA